MWCDAGEDRGSSEPCGRLDEAKPLRIFRLYSINQSIHAPGYSIPDGPFPVVSQRYSERIFSLAYDVHECERREQNSGVGIRPILLDQIRRSRKVPPGATNMNNAADEGQAFAKKGLTFPGLRLRCKLVTLFQLLVDTALVQINEPGQIQPAFDRFPSSFKFHGRRC